MQRKVATELAEETSPAVQGLRFHSSTAGSSGSNPGWGTKIPQAKKKKKQKTKKLAEDDFALNGGPRGKKEMRKVGDKDGVVLKGTG